MTETSQTNLYQNVLGVGGVIAIAVGLVVLFIGKGAAEGAASATGMSNAFREVYGLNASVADTSGYGWMWFGIVLAVLGALALLGLLIVKAGQQKP